MMFSNTVRILLAGVALGVALVGYSLGGQPPPQDTPKVDAQAVRSVAFSPDGKSLAALIVEQGVALWDPSTGKNIANLKGSLFDAHPAGSTFVRSDNRLDNARHVAYTADGKILQIWNENGSPQRYDLASGKSIDPAFAVCSPDGKIAVVQGNGILGGKLPAPLVRELTRPFDATRLLDASSGHNLFTLTGAQFTGPGYPNGFTSCSFSRDGKILAVWGEDQSIMMWDVVSRKNTANFPQGYRGSWFGLSPDGKILAVQEFKKSAAAPDVSAGVLTLLDVASGKKIGALEPDQDGGSPPRVIFSPDSKTVTAENNVNSPRKNWYSIRVWNATTGKKLAPLQKSPATIRKPVVFSPDSNTLAGLCEDHKVRVWDFSSGKIAAVLALPFKAELIPAEGGCLPVFSPDGKNLAVGCWDGTVKLWTLPPDPKGEAAMSFGPAAFPVAEEPKLQFKPIPDGYTVQSQGTAMFFRDASGNKKPMPDGDYRLPNGTVIHVRGGHNTAFK